MFLTGKALFITALDVVRPEIEFRLPPKWQLITPWKKEGERYVATDAVELTEAAILTGRFEERTITSGEVTVWLGMGSQTHVLRALYAARQQPVTLESLIAATNRVAGADFRPLFERYVLRVPR